MPVKQTPKHPRAVDWTHHTPIPVGRSVHERRRWETPLQAEAADLARLACRDCGHRGLALFARFDRRTGAYASVLYCPACGWSVAD